MATTYNSKIQNLKSTFPAYGWFGLALIVMGQMLTYVHWRPLSDYWFGLVWFGYILAADALIYRRDGRSLIINRRRDFLLMFPASAAGWWGFEAANEIVQNWHYLRPADIPWWWQQVMQTVFFSTVVPALWLSGLLFLPLFQRAQGWRQLVPSRLTLLLLVLLGGGCIILPILYPRYAFPLIWGCLALILDPINYARGKPSLLGYWARGDWRVPLALYVGGTFTGLLWEFWNWTAMPKWYYTVPFVDFLKIFEMPILGYLGYGPFAWEVFALYHFIRGFVLPPTKVEEQQDYLEQTGL